MTDVTSTFEASRAHLRQVAYRMLGSAAEADDAVQEAWLRLQRSDTGDVANLTGWLTTVVARVCLDMLRRRREAPLDQAPAQAIDPRDDAQLAEHVGLAMLVVLEALDPAERIAFVLHDVFGVPFDEIADIVGKSAEATRQLASRARRRVRGVPVDEALLASQRTTVERVIAALRARDVEALVALLDPEVVVRAGGRTIHGARTWAENARAYSTAHPEAHVGLVPALLDGVPGAILAPAGQLRRALRFTFDGARVVAVDITDVVSQIEVSAF
ncbi:MAG: sigma-70 family RNA polymerase sigma factor [Deltaproteobacteria bacterium]|nr:sigma-70 family RNA polymerase sigma factor [Deltaproteobacteria bacterium]